MRILAVDLGLARTGIAVCDELEMLASPVGTVAQPDMDKLLDEVVAIAERERVREIVVGHPRNMDGSRGESAQRAEAFAEALGEVQYKGTFNFEADTFYAEYNKKDTYNKAVLQAACTMLCAIGRSLADIAEGK